MAGELATCRAASPVSRSTIEALGSVVALSAAMAAPAAAAAPRFRVGGFDEALSREAVEGLLRDAPGAPDEAAFVCVGDVIDTSQQESFLRWVCPALRIVHRGLIIFKG